jgi:hypothetical protein
LPGATDEPTGTVISGNFPLNVQKNGQRGSGWDVFTAMELPGRDIFPSLELRPLGPQSADIGHVGALPTVHISCRSRPTFCSSLQCVAPSSENPFHHLHGHKDSLKRPGSGFGEGVSMSRGIRSIPAPRAMTHVQRQRIRGDLGDTLCRCRPSSSRSRISAATDRREARPCESC